MNRFQMTYKDVPKMRECYPFLKNASDIEIIILLRDTCKITPDDKEFANACRLELIFRDKYKITQ